MECQLKGKIEFDAFLILKRSETAQKAMHKTIIYVRPESYTFQLAI